MGQTFCVPESDEGKLRYSKPVGVPASNDETATYRLEGREVLMTSPDEVCKTAYDLFQHGHNINPDAPCVGSKRVDGSGYDWLSYADVNRRSKNVGSGLIKMGLCPTIEHPDEPYCQTWRFIGFMAKNRVEFALVEQAANAFNMTIVPVYDTLGHEVLDFICGQTKLTTLCCSIEAMRNVVKSLNGSRTHALSTLVVLGEITQADRDSASAVNLKLVSFAEVEEAGAQSPQPISPPKPEDINTFCYTSGTTGMPKGAMITHSQLVATVGGAMYHRSLNLSAADVYLSYLPIAHILERIVNQAFLFVGARIGYYSGDTLKIVEDAQALKPTVFVSVPRLYNRIYDKIVAGAEAAGGIKKKLFYKALNAKLERVKKDACVTHPLWDRLVFSKPKTVLGGNVRVMLTGAAPISASVHDALRCIFCVPILEGFGMTESTGGTCISFADDPETGHVGGPIGCAEMKLVSVPEMNYSVHDTDAKGVVCPRGEICIKGNAIFPGYFKDAEKTKEAIDSAGWLHTGDIGTIRPNGSLQIIDRLKNIFKLSQGEYVAAEKIEVVYQQAASIAQCFIYGRSTETFVVAIIVPDVDYAKVWWNGRNKGTEFPGLAAVCEDKEFVAMIRSEMTVREKEDKLNGFEKAKKFHLSPELFSVENNLLTPTFKLKRKDAREAYAKEIEAMYS